MRGILLPSHGREQVTAQYADDTSFTLSGKEVSATTLVHTLDTFCSASGLVLNWNKSCGYWKRGRAEVRPP